MTNLGMKYKKIIPHKCFDKDCEKMTKYLKYCSMKCVWKNSVGNGGSNKGMKYNVVVKHKHPRPHIKHIHTHNWISGSSIIHPARCNDCNYIFNLRRVDIDKEPTFCRRCKSMNVLRLPTKKIEGIEELKKEYKKPRKIVVEVLEEIFDEEMKQGVKNEN